MGNISSSKMSFKSELIARASEFFAKYGVWVAYVLIGFVGKIGWDIVSKRKISLVYLLGTGCMAIFVGFVSCRWFMTNAPEKGPYIVPVLTLVSRDVLMFLSVIDWKKVLSVFFKVEIKEEK